ncbi:autotransporter assembly complex protein TamA [Halomonas daqiaonensis]|uniref:Translocation and assembly module subunit TamA n=1 Tax=Halomonas daqiaonensis TaxID=650850 RepID=A0A1H7FKN8_9GAMM|nr:autotransporter assembly complex family protein [Halomonas daqiaonensis]SEK24690.1 autotransporter secretion outer membrane protein TamA [Halomonas daqiaonensis]
MDNCVYTRLGMAAFFLGLAPGALALEATIEGIEDPLAENVRLYLEGLEAELYSPARLESEVLRRSSEALRVYGYYSPRIEPRFDDPEAPTQVTLSISPGEPVLIEVLELSVTGDAAEDPPFTEAIEDFPLEKGDRLRHAPFDSLRSRLANLALERGYFDWRFTDRRMEVRPYANSARLYLALDSGQRHRFGDVIFQGHHIETERLENLAPFTSGEPYLASRVARFNQRLGQTEWFASVNVRPRLQRELGRLALPEAESTWWQSLDVAGVEPVGTDPRIAADALVASASLQRPILPEVPIDVALTPADRHQFEVGVGYATDVGPRLRFAWDQPWINRYGHGLDHDLYLSGPEQRFTGIYTMPLADPLRDSYRFQYGLRHKDNEDTRTLESTVEAARRWKFDNDWEQTLYLRATYEDFTQAGVSNQVLLLYPGISWSRIRTRNPTFPTWGDRQRLAVEYSSDWWGSAAEFLRLTGDSEWIRMLGDDNRFVGRVGLGSITTDDFVDIPPSLRFFTGGDRSVRGYAYESLAPENDEGRLIGGEQLLTASLEAQRRITGKWWGAAFIDTGDAFNDWGPSDLKTGAGLGVRWISPVGPIRLDVAHPFDADDAFRIHFAIGPEF